MVTPSNVFDTRKTRMIGLLCGEEIMLSRFHRIPERNGRTDGQTDRFGTKTPLRPPVRHWSSTGLKYADRPYEIVNVDEHRILRHVKLVSVL